MAIKKSQIGEEISSSLVPVTNKCNQNCLHCSTREIFRNLDFSLKSTLKRVHQIGNLITLTGGEPTLSPNLFKIIDFAKKRGKAVELQTNGVTLSYFNLAKKLFLAGVNLFNVNLPSCREKLSDRITRTPGFYKKRIKGVKNLEKLGANIRLTHLINSLTYEDLPEFADWVSGNFTSIKYIQFSFIKIFASDRETPYPVPSYLVPRYEEVEPCLISALEKCNKYKIDFVIDHIPPCFLGDFANYHIDFIKVKNNAKSELQHSPLEKKKIKICRKCKLNNFCFGPRKDYLKLFNNKILLKPITNKF